MRRTKSKRSIVLELEVGETAVFPFSAKDDNLLRGYASTATLLGNGRKLSVSRDREKGIITVERYA